MTLTADAVARRLAECLDEDAIDYAIGGALALGAWGAPRATKDVDISIFAADDLPRLFDALERTGLMFDRTNAERDIGRIAMFKALAGPVAVDVFVSNHPFFLEMKRRRVALAVNESHRAYFISAEDLCVNKLLYGRGKDMFDLERLFAVRPMMDFAYVRSWLTQMVPAGDRRFALLDDLERRFVDKP